MQPHESEFLHTDPPPVDMLLFCPACGVQHIDKPEGEWLNPPHKSHLCAGCGCVWRQCDIPTNGVAAIATRGKDDTWPRVQERPMPERDEFPSGVGTALKHTWQLGQIWQTRLLELGESDWVPVGDAGRAEPVWDHQQEYRRIR